MAIDLREIYKPHAGQAEMHNSPAKVKVLVCGRRFGKSRYALFELLKTFIDSWDFPVGPETVPPFHAWVVAPAMPQARQAWDELINFIPTELVAEGGIHLDEHFIYLRGSEGRSWGKIEVKSAFDPENLQTAGLDFLWITESQDISDKAFEKVLPTLRSPQRMGKAVFEGIPSLWPDHWFRRVFMSAKRGREGYYWKQATAFENPLLSEEARVEIEADRELLPDKAWRRLYLAEFSEAGGYFSNIDNCISGDELSEPVGGRYVAGLDLGRKVDASVLHVMDATRRQVVHHRSWDAGQSWPIQREGVAHECGLWSMELLVCDATGMGGDIFSSELEELGIPMEPVIISQSKRDNLLKTLAVSLERETVHFPPIPSLLRQLRAFQYRKTSSGGWRAEAPPGEHDDEVFALALALQGCDPAPALGYVPRLTPMTYVPSERQIAGGGLSSGARMMRERREERQRERLEKAGVEG